MAKTNVLTNEQWVEIKNEFMLGKSANAIAKQFGVTHRTILLRAKKESWEHGMLSSEMVAITSSIDAVINKVSAEQIPGIEAKLLDMLALRKKAATFMNLAMDVNLRNMEEVAKEPDLNTRISMMARMKATMPDLAAIQPAALANPLETEEKSPESVIKFYLPKRDDD